MKLLRQFLHYFNSGADIFVFQLLCNIELRFELSSIRLSLLALYYEFLEFLLEENCTVAISGGHLHFSFGRASLETLFGLELS